MQPSERGSNALYKIIGLLEDVTQTPNGYKARCPSHEDRKPSLGLSMGNNGSVILNCLAGCETAAVLSTIGLTLADLYDVGPNGGKVRRFRLLDPSGSTVATHVREDTPDGKQMHWERDGKRSLNGLPLPQLPLYRLPDLLAATVPSVVYVVEGETSADALAERGLLAVGTATGASAVPSVETLAPLKNHIVVLWPDNDPPGTSHMLSVASQVGITVRWLIWPEAPDKGDAADYFAAGGSAERLASMIQDAPPGDVVETPNGLAVVDRSKWNLVSSIDLARMELPEPKWAVPGIVPEGVFLVAGKPKFGKSWWVLDLCIAVATGGKAWGRIAVEQGEALYISYEDSMRRLQERQERVIGHRRGIPGMDYVTKCPRADEGGIELVLAWVREHPRARLIVIDPLEKWRPEENAKRQLYRQDYDSLEAITDMARQLGISVIIVHHCNKMPSPDDPFDAISGSTGLTGAADAIGVFRKEYGVADGVLFIKGKDVDFNELAFKSRVRDDYPAPAWELLGSGDAYRQSRERFEVLEILWAEPWKTPADLADLVMPAVAKGTMRKRCFDMTRDGLLRVRESRYGPGIDRDSYLIHHGHPGSEQSLQVVSDADNTRNGGNARNAVTLSPPVTPVPAEDANNTESECSVTTVTDVTSVTDGTGVTKPAVVSAGPIKGMRYCEDCGQPTNNAELSRCYRCRIKNGEIVHPKTGRKMIAPGIYETDPELPM